MPELLRLPRITSPFAVSRKDTTELPNAVHTLERDGVSLHIAGIDDYWENKARLRDVLGQLPDEGAAILLAHEPDFAVISAQSGRFDLQLSPVTRLAGINKIGVVSAFAGKNFT